MSERNFTVGDSVIICSAEGPMDGDAPRDDVSWLDQMATVHQCDEDLILCVRSDDGDEKRRWFRYEQVKLHGSPERCPTCGYERPPKGSTLVALTKEVESLRESQPPPRSTLQKPVTVDARAIIGMVQVPGEGYEYLPMLRLTDPEEITRLFGARGPTVGPDGKEIIERSAFYATSKNHSALRIAGLAFHKDTDLMLQVVKFAIGGSPDLLLEKKLPWRVIDFQQKTGLRAYPVILNGNCAYAELLREDVSIPFPDRILSVVRDLYLP